MKKLFPTGPVFVPLTVLDHVAVPEIKALVKKHERGDHGDVTAAKKQKNAKFYSALKRPRKAFASEDVEVVSCFPKNIHITTFMDIFKSKKTYVTIGPCFFT